MSNECPPSKGRVTIAQIATLANVSKATVSTVLNSSPSRVTISEATRQRVIETAKRLGYRANAAARSLVTGRSHTILLVVLGAKDVHLFERLQGAESHLTPLGYPLLMCTVDAKMGLDSYLSTIHSNRADGVLLTGLTTPGSYPLLQTIQREAAELGKPVVATANAFASEGMSAIAHVDDVSGGYTATAHLIEHGHRRIAYLGVEDQSWSRDRQTGYEKALAEAGIEFDPSLVQHISLDFDTHARSYEVVTRLAAQTDLTALFAATDQMAVVAMSALRAAGKTVPADCAVIGYDGDPSAAVCEPPLTTICNPFFEQGAAAAKMLVDLIEGRPVSPVQIPVSLITRRSCGCTAR